MIGSYVYFAVSLFFPEYKSVVSEELQPVEQTTLEGFSIITESLDTIVEEQQQAELSAETIKELEESSEVELFYDHESVCTNYFEAQ